jgi:hypothetical protein
MKVWPDWTLRDWLMLLLVLAALAWPFIGMLMR